MQILIASLKKVDYNTKITEIENNIPDTSRLASNAALTPKVTEIEK